MRPKVDQMFRTLLFKTHFSQIGFEIQGNSPPHMAKRATEACSVSSVFEVYESFPGEAKLFWANYMFL